MPRSLSRLAITLALASAAAAASAQPKFIHTSNANDLTADGNSVVGTILDPNVDARLHIFTRGVGHTFPGPIFSSRDGYLQISDDRAYVSCSLYNGLFGPQNPPFGNYGTSGHGHFTPHRLDTATGVWTNAGSFPDVGGLGAAVCDGTIATAYGLSSGGRFITGGGWYGPYGTTSCSMRGFVYDANDGSVRLLPMVGTGCQQFSQGERISTNGLVVMGSDSHEAPDQSICNARTLTVWERSSTAAEFSAANRTVLDGWGAGGVGAAAMTSDGTQIAARMTSEQAIALGDAMLAANLHKYIKNTTTGQWDRISLGRCAPRDIGSVSCMQPTAISDDGNTIIGTAKYGGCTFFDAGRPFIWRPTINGGVPIDFQDYLDSLPGGNPFGDRITPGSALSADGNAMLASLRPLPPNCPNGGGLQGLGQSGILYLDGSSIGCEPPRIAGGPYDRAQAEFTRFGIVGNVFVSGSAPMTAQWQKEVPSGSNNWVNLTDSCGFFTNDNTWVYDGTTGFQLRVNMLATPADRDGRYRVVITNPCGTATSQVANISAVSGACCYNQGGNIVCSVELRNRCEGSPSVGFLGGIYSGDGTTCQPSSCDVVIGACCTGPGGPNAACVLTIAPDCTRSAGDGGFAGTFAGAGTTCGPVACGAVSGACCFSPDGFSTQCLVELSSHCTASVANGGVAGVYAGNMTTCSPGNVCPPGTPGIGACCFNPSPTAEIVCAVIPQSTCLATYTNSGRQGKYQGDGVTCGPSSCRPSLFGSGAGLGACCFTDPANPSSGVLCTIQVQANCVNYPNGSTPNNQGPFTPGVGGIFVAGQCCTPSSTPPISGCTSTTNCAPFFGACIHAPFDGMSGAICTLQNVNRCERRYNAGGLFGEYVGDSTVCSPANIQAYSGACCYVPIGGNCAVCTIQPADPTTGLSPRCTDEFNGGLNGTFAGIGTTCSPNPCPPSEGACCVAGSCTFTCESICDANAGTYLGDGTSCTPDPCNPSTGACCCGSSCTITTAANCLGANRSFAGAGTSCTPFSNTTPCCRGDYNKTGAPATVQDIFDFLSGYFSSDACADSNDSGGAPTVQDIFDYLSAYFGGGC